MKKQKRFSKYRIPQLIFFFMTLLCWSMALFQSASKQLKTEQAVPAFQNETIPSPEMVPAYQTDIFQNTESFNDSFTLSDAVCAFQTEKSQTLELSSDPKQLTRETSSTYLLSLTERIDSGASLISSHSDTNYSDFYLYSPVLEKQFQISPVAATGSNLQIVFVWNKDGSCKHIYLGMPYIEYCF